MNWYIDTAIRAFNYSNYIKTSERYPVKANQFSRVKKLMNKDPKLLWEAVQREDSSVVRFLTSRQVSPNFSFRGTTPLMIAVQKANLELVKILVEEGNANLNQWTKGGSTVAIRASYTRQTELIKYIFSKANLNIPDNYGTYPLYFLEAERPGNLEELRKIALERTSAKIRNAVLVLLNEKYLAHVWKIRGKGYSTEKAPPFRRTITELEGAHGTYMQHKICKSLKAFDRAYALVGQTFDDLVLAFYQSNTLRYDAQSKLDFFKSKNLLLLQSGFKGHYVSFFLYDNFFVLVNRGAAHRKTVEVFSFNAAKLTIEVINEIQLFYNRSQLDYEYHVFSYLQQTLEFKKKYFEKNLEHSLFLPEQEGGHCTFDNSEGVVLVYLILKKLKEQSLLIRNIHVNKRVINLYANSQRKIYDRWLTEHKILALNQYQKLVQSPEYPNTPAHNLLKIIAEKTSYIFSEIGHKRQRLNDKSTYVRVVKAKFSDKEL